MAVAFGLIGALRQTVVAEPAEEETLSLVVSKETAHVVTLDEALRYTETNQPSLRAALARVAAAQADARVPRAAWLPTVAVAAEVFEGTTNNTTGSYLGVPYVALPRIGATPVTSHGSFAPSTSTLGAISVGQELLEFGRIAAQSAAADAVVVSEHYRAEAERLGIELIVKESYFAVSGAKAVLRAAQGAYERTRVHRDLAEAGVKSGLYAPIERTRAQADLARFEVAVIRARGGLVSAQVVLAAAVGVPERRLDAAEAPSTYRPLPSLDNALAAGARDPVVREVSARLSEQRAVTRAIAAEKRPNLVLTGTFSGRAGGASPSSGSAASLDGLVPYVPNWDLGLVLVWPIFDGVVLARQRVSLAREVARARDVEAVAQQEQAAIQRAYVSTQVAQAALAGLQSSVEAARANYEQAEARFKAGLGTSLELADAEYLRTDAEIQLAGGQFELLRARAVLSKLIAEES